jgi:hypothetical protein
VSLLTATLHVARSSSYWFWRKSGQSVVKLTEVMELKRLKEGNAAGCGLWSVFSAAPKQGQTWALTLSVGTYKLSLSFKEIHLDV